MRGASSPAPPSGRGLFRKSAEPPTFARCDEHAAKALAEGSAIHTPSHNVHVDAHPLLDPGFLWAEFPEPLGELRSSPALLALLSLTAQAPLQSDDTVRAQVRELLRHGGYKPTGRGKPASEYLVRAVGEGKLPSINAAVDACNVISLHSGLPISVVDLDKVKGALRITTAPPGTSYIFNASGQEMALDGLLCLFDDEGPCANAVKDSHRTKTHTGTMRTLSVIWGTRTLVGRTRLTVEWYERLVRDAGAVKTTSGRESGS